VAGATRWEVPDIDVATDLVQRASSARAVESTAMNATSSRSHSVFMLYITGRHPTTNSMLQGCLCLVDLAGRYRQPRSPTPCSSAWPPAWALLVPCTAFTAAPMLDRTDLLQLHTINLLYSMPRCITAQVHTLPR
jgi:hypothetical protein